MTLNLRIAGHALLLGAAFLCLSGVASAASVTLSGANEVPPVQTSAMGTSTITVAEDGAVVGTIKTTGIAGSAAHIHQGAVGQNGPVVVALTKGMEGEWVIPAGTRLTPEQVKSFKAGELYVNVHSEANKKGEIRAQLTP